MTRECPSCILLLVALGTSAACTASDQPRAANSTGNTDSGVTVVPSQNATGSFHSVGYADGGGVNPVGSVADGSAGLPDAHLTGNPICNGELGARLSLTVRPSSPLAVYGTSVLDEHGGYFFILTGACEAFILNGPGNRTVSLTLTPSMAAELATTLNLADWPELAGPHCYLVDDLGAFSLRFGETELAVTNCQPEDSDSRAWDALAAFGREVERLYAQGEPVAEQPVRYSVLVANDFFEVVPDTWFDGAPQWPLGDLASVAFVPGQDSLPVPVWTVTEQQAVTLRNIRDRWMAGEWGGPFPGTHQIPIVDAAGGRYLFYTRDVIERFEDGDGHLNF